MELRVGISQAAIEQWGYKTSLTDEETLYPLPFTVLLGISAQMYRHPATSNTVHSILVNVTETSFKYYAGQYNLSCRPVPDADGWWFAFGISQLQWGFTNNTGRPYITFPFKFSNVFTAISCICHNGSPSEANTVYNVSISGMNIGASGGGSGKYWCAFGVAQQQWGYYVESQNPTDYRYWSIPFTSHYITMATKTYYEPKEEAVPWLVGIDMQKFICGYGANFIGSSYVSCVGIGCQPQWGVGAASTNIMLPIPYTKVKFITLATSSMLNPSQGNISVAYHDSTLDSIRFQIRWQGLAAEYTGAWLTLGI